MPRSLTSLWTHSSRHKCVNFGQTGFRYHLASVNCTCLISFIYVFSIYIRLVMLDVMHSRTYMPVCVHNVLLSVSSVYCVKLNLGFLAACIYFLSFFSFPWLTSLQSLSVTSNRVQIIWSCATLLQSGLVHSTVALKFLLIISLCSQYMVSEARSTKSASSWFAAPDLLTINGVV